MSVPFAFEQWSTLNYPEPFTLHSLGSLIFGSLMVLGFPQPKLPLEVFAIIIDFLWEDRRTLKICALVDRPWLHFTRLRLFRDLKIDLSTSLGQSRIALLAGGSTVHCTYIRKLHIAIEDYEHYSDISHETCSRILWNLPRLHTLSLDELVVAESKSSDNTIPASHSIDTLKLMFNDLQPADSNLDVLTLFSHVRHLDIASDDVEELDEIWPNDDDLEHIQPAHHLQISESLTLSLSSPGVSTLRKLLQPSLTTITILRIYFCPAELYGPLGKLIDDLSPHLRELYLNICSDIEPYGVPEDFLTKSYWSNFKISQCHALETMTLLLEHVFEDDEVPEAFSLLLQTVPVTIRNLVFELESPSFDSESGWFALDLGQIETILSRYTNLEVVKFEIKHANEEQYGKVQAFIIKGLPKLQRQGLLKFETK